MYLEFRVCERWGLKLRGVKEVWEDNDQITQLNLLSYEQIREYES